MNCDKNTMRLYAVTDRAWVGRLSLYEQVEAALQHGVTCVQLREKDLDPDTCFSEAVALRELCHRYSVPFLINDNVDLALRCGADGVHVGQDDMDPRQARALLGPDKIVGVTAHNLPEALAAVEAGADYLGLGCVFTTSTKQNVVHLPYDTLRDICHTVPIPTVAIGGVSRDNLMQLAGSGVDGVAVVSAIFAQEDPGQAAEELSGLVQQMLGGAQK